MNISFDYDIQKLLLGKKLKYFSGLSKKLKTGEYYNIVNELMDTEWFVDYVKVLSVESHINDTIKVCAYIQNDDASKSNEKRFWAGYAGPDLMKKLSENEHGESVLAVYVKLPESDKNFLAEFFTQKEITEYKKLSVAEKPEEDVEDFYKKLIYISCMDECYRKMMRMRWGLDPLCVKDGMVMLDEGLSAASTDNKLLSMLCSDLIPGYIHKEIEKNKEMAENKKLSDVKRNTAEIRNLFYPAIPFGLPIKRFTVANGCEQLDKVIYGRKNTKKRVLQYLYAARKYYWGKTIQEINSTKNEKAPVIIAIIGRDGSGKELLAKEVSKVASYTYIQFDANSFSTDTMEVLGSSVIYQNTEPGSIAKALLTIGDNGSMIIKNFGSAQQNVKNALADVLTSGVLRENNLECNIDLSRIIFFITANDKSEIPGDIFDKACVINLDKMTEEERLVIGKDYMLPDICKELYIDQSLIKISDEDFNKLCNQYRTTNSLDKISTNLREVMLNISNDYMEQLENKETVEVTGEYIEKCLFTGTYEDYVYDISRLMEKFMLYRGFFSEAEQVKIEDLFEEYEVMGESEDKGKLEDKLRYYVNYVPIVKENSITIEDIIKSYKQMMDKEEYGHHEAKQAIIDSMIENILSGKNIFGSLKILLHGPAGTGKTMLGHMIADLLDVPFVKISLNGKEDARSLKGFPYCYKDSHLGEVADKLRKKCGSRGCVLLLDEGEKAGKDIMNTLFDITDPSEGGFYDDFLGDFVDTSRIITIMTCNDITRLPEPLLDRFKVIRVDGYTEEEKVIIAKDYVIPKCLKELSLVDKIEFRKDAVETMISDYISTSSVRQIEKSVRKIVVGVYKSFVMDNPEEKLVITKNIVRDIHGARPIKTGNIPGGDYKPGTMNCLAVRGDGGGSVFPVEVELTPYIEKRTITGSCKEMILESVEIADVVVSNMLGRKIENTAVSFAEQSVPKDGPSAGLSIVLCMLSAHLGISLSRTIAATGEIDIKGNVFAIGGLKEKIDAARREGVTTVYIPEQNYDYMKQNGELKKYTDIVDIIPISHVSQAVKELFGEAIK